MTNFINGKKKILIVEDSDVITNFLADILEKYGTIDIAKNGQEALTKVSFNYFDVIVSDIKMPIMDGIEFYKSAVETDSSLKSRFLFFTSSFDDQHINFFIENNVPFLHKPAPTKDIDAEVSNILNRSYAGQSEGTGSKENIFFEYVQNDYDEGINNEASCC